MAIILNIIFILLCAVVAVSAETSRMSVKDVVQIAVNSNLVRAARFRTEAAQAGVAIAESKYFPKINLEETFAASNSPTQTFMMKLDEGRFTQDDFQIGNLNNPGIQHDFKTALVFTQPLFDPSISPAREIAARDAETQGIGLESTRQAMAFTAFRLYLEIQKAKAKVHAAEIALKEAKENLRLAKVRTEAGLGLRSDELRAKTHLASLEQIAITEKNILTLTKMKLGNLLGLKDGEILEVEDSVRIISPAISQEELIKAALENRSDLLQSKSLLERTDAEARLAQKSYLPSLSVFASYQINSRNTPLEVDNDSWMAGVTLKWQLFDGLSRHREYQRAAANRTANGEIVASITKDVLYSVKESLLKLDEADKRLEVAKNTVQDAEETVRLISMRYENSLATMFELLDAQTALNQSRSMLIENEADYALSGGQVYHTAGIFLKEIMK